MKFFVVEIIYTEPIENVSRYVDDHRAYLQFGYQSGMLLISGPQEPRVGGILIAKAKSREEVQSFCDGDPYNIRGVARHRIIEFIPKSHQTILDGWVAK